MGGDEGNMRELFLRSGIALADVEASLFFRYYTELVSRNAETDLTGIVSLESVVVKHFVDSILVGKYVDLPSPLLDIGSGAGFPIIPLKICHPGLSVILAENRKKRVAFLLDIIDILGLSGAEIYPHRVTGDFPLSVRGAITRALESITATLSRCAPFLREGAKIIFMKGPECDQEVNAAIMGMGGYYELFDDISYTIPETPFARRLIVFSRNDVPYHADTHDKNHRHHERPERSI